MIADVGDGMFGCDGYEQVGVRVIFIGHYSQLSYNLVIIQCKWGRFL